MKKLKVKKKLKFFFYNLKLFMKIIPPHAIQSTKKTDSAFCNKSIMANKLHSTNLEKFLRRIKSRNIKRVNGPKLARMEIFKI